MNDELKKLSEAFGTISKKYLQTKADMGEKDSGMDKKMSDMMGYVYQLIDNLHRRVDYVSQAGYEIYDEHMSKSTHLPKLSVSQMNKLLENCGASDDYVCNPKQVMAKALGKIVSVKTPRGTFVEAEYIPQKK